MKSFRWRLQPVSTLFILIAIFAFGSSGVILVLSTQVRSVSGIYGWLAGNCVQFAAACSFLAVCAAVIECISQRQFRIQLLVAVAMVVVSALLLITQAAMV